MKGKLYLCATPIGNLSDMTPRAVETLKNVDLIAAEDTRNSIKLLNHFDIHTPMTSYHEFNRFDKADELVRQLLEGKNVACITDAGMPGISDPGEVLVQKCVEAGIEVTVLPGASAVVSALAVSGLPTGRFRFEGFLPREKKETQVRLEEIRFDTATLVLYEAPHRLTRTLETLLAALGDRKAAICRELTKKHETIERMRLSEALAHYAAEEPKGEFVLVIEGMDPKEKQDLTRARWADLSIEDHYQKYLDEGMDRSEAMKKVATDRGIPKREVYQALNG